MENSTFFHPLPLPQKSANRSQLDKKVKLFSALVQIRNTKQKQPNNKKLNIQNCPTITASKLTDPVQVSN